MKTQLEIGGMSCQSCVAHVTKALREVSQVREVHVQLEPPNATIEHEGASLETLTGAVESAGYTVKVIS